VFVAPSGSAAGVDVLLNGARLTGDLTAPFETAMTVDTRLGRVRLVASTAAEQFATVNAR